MLDHEWLDWTAENMESIARAAEAGPDVPIPTCEGWTMSDLLEHVSRLMNGWYQYNIVRDIDDPDTMAAKASAPPVPDDHQQRIAYLRAGTRDFVDLVRHIDLDLPVWALGLPNERRRFWLQRTATEFGVHRFDAESAVGTPTRLPPERAAASIDETMRGLWRSILLRPENPPPPPPIEEQPAERKRIESVSIPSPSAPLGIHATDADVTWRLNPKGREFEVIAGGELPETVLSGEGHDIVMLFWGRTGVLTADERSYAATAIPPYPGATVRNAPELTVNGDAAVVDEWNLCVRSEI